MGRRARRCRRRSGLAAVSAALCRPVHARGLTDARCSLEQWLTEASLEAYTLSIVGVLALCLVSILLAIHSGYSKGRAGALSGPVLPADDGNPLYRIDRVHVNSVEALAPFVVPAVLAMMVGVGPTTLAVLVWGHVAVRLIHLVTYLRGGNAAKGGS